MTAIELNTITQEADTFILADQHVAAYSHDKAKGDAIIRLQHDPHYIRRMLDEMDEYPVDQSLYEPWSMLYDPKVHASSLSLKAKDNLSENITAWISDSLDGDIAGFIRIERKIRFKDGNPVLRISVPGMYVFPSKRGQQWGWKMFALVAWLLHSDLDKILYAMDEYDQEKELYLELDLQVYCPAAKSYTNLLNEQIDIIQDTLRQQGMRNPFATIKYVV